jgi:integrase
VIAAFGSSGPRQLRNRAMMAVPIGCGLRRAEAAALKIEDIQLREGQWTIADLKGKGGHIRTVLVPDWVKARVDAWPASACLTTGILFRAIKKAGRTWGNGFTPKVIRFIVKEVAVNSGYSVWLLMTSEGPVHAWVIKRR